MNKARYRRTGSVIFVNLLPGQFCYACAFCWMVAFINDVPARWLVCRWFWQPFLLVTSLLCKQIFVVVQFISCFSVCGRAFSYCDVYQKVLFDVTFIFFTCQLFFISLWLYLIEFWLLPGVLRLEQWESWLNVRRNRVQEKLPRDCIEWSLCLSWAVAVREPEKSQEAQLSYGAIQYEPTFQMCAHSAKTFVLEYRGKF